MTGPHRGFSLKKMFIQVLNGAGAIILAVIAGLLILNWIPYFKKVPTHSSPELPPIQVGTVLPDFELTSFDQGKVVKLSQIEAKIYVINFWATWCTPCMIEMPSLIQLRKDYQPKGLELISINLDEEPKTVLPQNLQKLGIDFPVYTDTEGSLSDLFSVAGIPLTVILDKNRTILFVETGDRDWNGHEIHQKIDRWLSSPQ